MMQLNTFLLIIDLLLINILGDFLKKFDYTKITIYSSLAVGLTVPILFILIPGSNIYYVTFVRLWIVILGVVFICPQNLLFKNIFKDLPSRYMIVGISNSIGASTIGRLTPAIVLLIWQSTHSFIPIAFYISSIAMLTSFFLYKIFSIKPA